MRLIILLTFTILFSNCRSQSNDTKTRSVGGPCEDCEALLDYQFFSEDLSYVDTLPGFRDNAPKINIRGTVFLSDGKTPANNVILYVYHTDRNGIYNPSAQPIGWEGRHGQFRGWMITNSEGKYAFYTFRPAAYPNGEEPEHIHVYVKEPSTIPYCIDNILFESDPMLTIKTIESAKKRGGSGIVRLEMKNGILTATRDIVLGLNIPDYN